MGPSLKETKQQLCSKLIMSDLLTLKDAFPPNCTDTCSRNGFTFLTHSVLIRTTLLGLTEYLIYIYGILMSPWAKRLAL